METMKMEDHCNGRLFYLRKRGFMWV